MTFDKVRTRVFQGALAGSARIAVRILLGLASFRLLYQSLDREEFGFWSVLWAFYGYGVLLDFGFGFIAQKRVAELSLDRNWQHLSRVLSTLFFVYFISALVAAAIGLIFAGPIVDLFHVDPVHRDTFRLALQVFLVGVGFAFPLGLFPEVLQGQQRIATAHQVAIASVIANFLSVVAVVGLHLSFVTLVVLSLLSVLVPYAIAAVLALRPIPEVRIRANLVSRAILRENRRFGFHAQFSTLGTVLRQKADQPVISAILGVAAVTPYQPGSKIGEMFGLLTRQIADVLSPTSADLHARGDTAGLRRLLTDGLRFSVLVATPLYIATAACLDGLIHVLTGASQPTREMLIVGHLLLLGSYSLVITHWVFKRMFLMAGQARRLMIQGLLEASASLALGITLTSAFKTMLGMAWGSMISSVVFGWLVLWAWAADEAAMSRWRLFYEVVLRAWLACLPMIMLAAALRLQPWWDVSRWLFQGMEAIALFGVGFAGVWYLGLAPRERAALTSRLIRRGAFD